MICFAYKWYGDKKVHFVRPSEKDPWDDFEMVKALWKLFDEADVLIGHNADKFDTKKANALFIRHGLLPPSPSKSVDTLKVARRNFNNTSNRLDALGESYGLGRKKETKGFMKMFQGTMNDNDPKFWRMMEMYNRRDVVLLEKLYKKLLPWVKNHPIDPERPDGCPNCGSTKLQARGYQRTRTVTYKRYRCNSCGTWSRSRLAEKETAKPNYV